MTTGFAVEVANGLERWVVRGPWRDEYATQFAASDVRELELNYAKDWDAASGLGLLRQLPGLTGLTIIFHRTIDLSPVGDCLALRRLQLVTPNGRDLDLSRLSHVRDLGVEWISGCEAVHGLTELESVFIDGYPAKTLEELSGLSALRSLQLANGPLTSLAGCDRWPLLEELALGRLFRLIDADAVALCQSLRVLELRQCRRLTSLDAFAALRQLRRLLVIDAGAIESLRPLRGLAELELEIFFGSTDVLDGDLTVLFELPRLQSVAFADRRHYTHKLEQVVVQVQKRHRHG